MNSGADILTSAEMRAIERAAMTSGEVTGLELMERAGRGVVDAIFAEWPALAATSCRATILCGPGNNGGDGFVVARLLKAWGWEVAVYLLGEAERLPPDARTNCDRWRALGPVLPIPAVPTPQMWQCDLIIDALFGTGLTRPLEGRDELLHDIVSAADRWERDGQGPRVVAVDIASGICADSGRELRCATGYSNQSVEANLTVTFHRAKVGHFCADGYAAHRALRVVDIGLQGGGALSRVTRESLWPMGKHHLDHKYVHGSVLVLTGGFGKTGAARLAARAALRAGAGVVTLGAPGAAQMEVAAQITSLMLARIETPDDLTNALQDQRLQTLCLGPGLGRDRARDLVPVALACGQRRLVLDADALTAFEEAPDALFDRLYKTCVLTPHRGEFARLFPDIAAKLAEPARVGPAMSDVDAVREAAARAGCVVLLKGAATMIADPDGNCSIHAAQYDRAAPWLATAGSGDVLAGIITGLLAQSIPPLEAAKTGAWLHTECARHFGPGLIAEDLPDLIPLVFRDLEL